MYYIAITKFNLKFICSSIRKNELIIFTVIILGKYDVDTCCIQ